MDDVNIEEVEHFVEESFYKGVRKFSDGEQKKRVRTSLHISSMSYDCSRKLWYEIVTQRDSELDEEGLYRTWIGTKLHETEMFNSKHEIKVKYASDNFSVKVGGQIDEILNYKGKKIIVDKKFVSRLPTEMREHHKRQVYYYMLLYEHQKKQKIDYVAVFYFLPTVDYRWSKKRYVAFVDEVTEDTRKQYKDRFEQVLKEVSDGLMKNELPPFTVSWYCNYCPFRVACDKNEKVVE